jgi:hypothetical protein
MHLRFLLIAGFIVCTVLSAAGCMAPSYPAAQVPPVTTALPNASTALAPFSLVPADLPSGFTLAEAREKNSSEVTGLALDLGWQAGYVVRYSAPLGSNAGITGIVQTLAVYPAKNIPGVISAIAQQDASGAGYMFASLPLPMSGGDSRAFRATAINATTTAVTGNPLTGTTGGAVSLAAQNFVEGIFTKGNYLDVIRLSGPSPDYGLLLNLSVTAYQRLP